MRKWPLNSIALVAVTHRKWRKAADRTSTQVATCMINKWRAKINRKEVYNVRNPPGMGDWKLMKGRWLLFVPSRKAFVTKHWKSRRRTSPQIKPKDKVSHFPSCVCYSICLRSCPVVTILTKAQFLNPFSTNLLCWASWAWAYSHNSRSTQTRTLQLPYPLVSKWLELILNFYYVKENEEPLTHLMDYPFGPFHSSETPYLTINCVTLAHQINI